MGAWPASLVCTGHISRSSWAAHPCGGTPEGSHISTRSWHSTSPQGPGSPYTHTCQHPQLIAECLVPCWDSFYLGMDSRVWVPHCHSKPAFCPKTVPIQRALSCLCKALSCVVGTNCKPPDLHRILHVIFLATSLVVSKQSAPKESLVILYYENILGDEFIVFKSSLENSLNN